MNIRKILILIKKDIYINYSLFLLIIFTEVIYFSFKLNASGIKLVLKFMVFILLAGTSISYFISYNAFNKEHRDKTLRTLKSLSFTNAEIYFSKLFLGYFSILFFISIPSFVFFIITKNKNLTISTEFGFYFIFCFTFLFFFEVSFFTFFFACFDKVVFIAVSQVFAFLLFFLIFKFESITGVKLLDIIKNKLVINMFEVLFYLSPVILVLFVFAGYKLYDKKISYRKYK